MQKVARLAAASLAVIALSACVHAPGVTPLPDGSEVALGQKAYVDGPLVQPVELLEDSRCPAKLQCVWAGRVRVKMLWIRPTGENQTFEVTLGEATSLADGAIRLDSVRPEKRADAPVRPEDYRFTLRFVGGI